VRSVRYWHKADIPTRSIRFVIAAPLPLALGIALDTYVAAGRAVQSPTTAVALAAAAIAALLGAWYDYRFGAGSFRNEDGFQQETCRNGGASHGCRESQRLLAGHRGTARRASLPLYCPRRPAPATTFMADLSPTKKNKTKALGVPADLMKAVGAGNTNREAA
jgi:hypothetical protein